LNFRLSRGFIENVCAVEHIAGIMQMKKLTNVGDHKSTLKDSDSGILQLVLLGSFDS
jgi:hypothetical protein